MNLGTLRIDELVLPISEIRLRNGRVEIQALAAVTADNVDLINAISADDMVMVHGDDGRLVVTGQPGNWALPVRLRVGDTLELEYRLDVDGKMTTEMRQRRADQAGQPFGRG